MKGANDARGIERVVIEVIVYGTFAAVVLGGGLLVAFLYYMLPYRPTPVLRALGPKYRVEARFAYDSVDFFGEGCVLDEFPLGRAERAIALDTPKADAVARREIAYLRDARTTGWQEGPAPVEMRARIRRYACDRYLPAVESPNGEPQMPRAPRDVDRHHARALRALGEPSTSYLFAWSDNRYHEPFEGMLVVVDRAHGHVYVLAWS